MPFRSSRFSGEPILEACLAGKHRMFAGATGEAVRKVQQALLDLGYRFSAGATGSFEGSTGAAVVAFKKAHALMPNDPVVGPGTMKALDADIVALDAGRPTPQPPAPPPSNTQMQGKFLFGGEGAKIPVVNFGLSFSLFKVWLRAGSGEFRGYTAASNQGLLGSAILETPVVNFVAKEDVGGLHGSVVDVTINSTTFVKSGGIADITLIVKNNSGPDKRLAFHADSVKGYSAVAGPIQFTATLLQLLSDENDPRSRTYVPW